jgi:hypothetical protein
MALYKLSLLRDGELVKRVWHDLADDLHALELARTFCRDHVVEVYEGVRLVARVKKGDEPLNVTQSFSGPPSTQTNDRGRDRALRGVMEWRCSTAR